jgi:hypothetical protein
MAPVKQLATKPHILFMLFIIFALALGLRLWGIHFGLPFEYHVDEVQYVRQAASMGQEGLKPVWWNNPPFFKYILLAEYGVLFVVGRALGWYTSIADFGAQNTLDPTRLYLLGRGTSAVFGAATVLLVYFLGKYAYRREAGIVAAWFLAVCFLHARDSHYAVNDIAVTFFVSLVVLAAIRIAQTGERKWYIVAGAALGLGFATKYSAVFAVISVALAHFLSPGVRFSDAKRLYLRRLAYFPMFAGMAALVASPYFVITPLNVIRDAYHSLYLAGQNGFDGWQIDAAGGYLFYLKTLVWGMGWGLLPIVVAGLAAAIFRHRRIDLVLLSFPILYFFVIGRQQSYYFARFIIPAIPVLLTLGAIFLTNLTTLAGSRLKSPANRALLLASLTFLLSAPSLLSVVRHNHLLSQKDTRTMAKEWIEANIPSGSRIAVDWPFYGPPLSTKDKPISGALATYDVTAVNGHGLADHSLDWYRQHSFDYLVTSNFISDLDLLDRQQEAARDKFYTRLDEELSLVHAFYPSRENRHLPLIFDELYGPAITIGLREQPGPEITIFTVND